ncbi:TonB-dependent receptor plug domain-containing protein [Anthocerotibacter panamensis]|uniref:TonB-dependent receptor plug domain-containing protein n=1 Tax=Anthocerotibacter panamensis TaxID=2857077 RepID=UPI001C40821F|nr:TonB-dependent receptor [Anthocerotibacter panamensis]
MGVRAAKGAWLALWMWIAVAAVQAEEATSVHDLGQVSTHALDLGRNLIADRDPSAPAPDVPDVTDLLDEVTVTATLSPLRLRETTSSLSILKSSDFELKGARQLGEALRGVPGVVSNQFGPGQSALGSYFIRGLPTTSTALLLDGRSINNINQENVDLAELPVFDIERVEILKGGATLLYGSTAVGGVINVISRRPPKTWEAATSVNFGSYGYSDYNVRFGGPLTENFRVSAFAKTFNSNNDYFYQVERPGATLTGINPFGEVNSSSFGLDWDWDIDARTSLSSRSYYRKGIRGLGLFSLVDTREAVPVLEDDGTTQTLPADQLGLNDAITRRLRIDYFGTALTLNHKLGAGEDSNLEVRFGYDRGFTTETEVLDGLAREEGTADVSVLNFRALHNWQISPGYNLTYGFDFIREYGDSFRLQLAPPPEGEPEGGRPRPTYQAGVNRPSFFALNTLKLTDNLTTTLGFRQTFSSSYNATVARSDSSSFDPSVGLIWQATPEFTLRSSFSRVYKTPNFNDLFGSGEVLGNPQLLPESGSTYDIGFDWQPTPTVSVRGAYFVNDIQNLTSYNLVGPDGASPEDDALIARGFEPNDIVRVNFPRVHFSGFELSFDWRFSPGWDFFATETYTDARVNQGFKAEIDQSQYPLVPFHSGQIGVAYSTPDNLRVALIANLQGLRSVDPYHIGPGFAQLPDPNGNPIPQIAYLPPGSLLPGYFTLDLTFHLPLNPRLALNGLVSNLTNLAYERFYGNGAPPINFVLGLEANF